MHAHLFDAGRRPLILSATLAITVAAVTAAPITYDVNCAGAKVGAVSMDTSGAGIMGTFTSTTGGPPPTLAAAAAACGEHHFNWYQVVTGDTNPPKDAGGNQLMPPYVDPPPNGYQGGDWQDNLPWYWNETMGPGETTTELSRQSTANTLKFSDFPSDVPGTVVMFSTWLVSLNADSSFHSWHDGLSWTFTQGKGVSNITALGQGVIPAKAQYTDIITGFATRIPEPSTVALTFAGAVLLFAFEKWKRA